MKTPSHRLVSSFLLSVLRFAHYTGINLVAALYYRLGQECGWVLRRLHEAGINWGTYTDLLGTHCNAHANNLAIVYPSLHRHSQNGGGAKEKQKDDDPLHRSLLAPLDFDMAFKREDFLPRLVSNKTDRETSPLGMGLMNSPLFFLFPPHSVIRLLLKS